MIGFLFQNAHLLSLLFQAGPHPPFKAQSQESPGLESKMDPKPDYGYTSYKGSGKLQGKVAIITGIKASQNIWNSSM